MKAVLLLFTLVAISGARARMAQDELPVGFGPIAQDEPPTDFGLYLDTQNAPINGRTEVIICMYALKQQQTRQRQIAKYRLRHYLITYIQIEIYLQ